MTLDYIINPCALALNNGFGSNLQAYRKAMLGELFFLFLIYFAGQIFKTFKTRQYIVDKQAGNNPQPLRLPWNQKHWNRTFPVLFANNAIAIGFCLLFSPSISALILSYIHLIGIVVHIVGELKMKIRISNIGLTFACAINIGLMLNGLININMAGDYVDNTGVHCRYQSNSW